MTHSVVFKNITKEYKPYTNSTEVVSADHQEVFYALQNITFTAEAGEIIGVVGLSGAGKSTLAHLITGGISPDSGEIVVEGKPSLISADTGLNDQLTGRENIELKCMIEGYGKKEINEMMPDIITLAEMDNVIDRPAKDYPNDIKSRLLFAITVHVDPDILVIDEAPSDEDQAFADKCMDKLVELRNKGKTIFFISHSLEQITAYCQKVLWLEVGELQAYGSPEEIIPKYSDFLEEGNPATEKPEKDNQVEHNRLEEQQNEIDNFSPKNATSPSRSRIQRKQKPSFKFINKWTILAAVLIVVFAGIFYIGKTGLFVQPSSSTVDGPAEENGPDIRYVTVNTASIRAKAEFGSKIVEKANFGHAFQVIETRDSSARSVEWLKVESVSTDLEGWISDKFLEKVSGEEDDKEVAHEIDQLIDFTPSLEKAIPMIGEKKGEEEDFDYTAYIYKEDVVTGFTITVNDSSKTELIEALGEPQLEQNGTLLYHGSGYDFIFKLMGDGVIDTLSVVKN